MECPECYCFIRHIDELHNCPCVDEKYEGFLDDWGFDDYDDTEGFDRIQT